MNISQINAIRASAGLPALVVDTEKRQSAKKRQAANRAQRAQQNRDLRTLRNSNKK